MTSLKDVFLTHRKGNFGNDIDIPPISVTVLVLESVDSVPASFVTSATIVFVDSVKHYYSDAVQITDLSIILDVLKQFPLEYSKTVLIDQIDHFPRQDIVSLYSYCVQTGRDLIFIAGVSQFDTLFNYDSFFQTVAVVKKL